MPIALLAFIVLVPVNWSSGTLEHEKDLNYDEIDKLSISNLGKGSKRYGFVYSTYMLYYFQHRHGSCCFFEELCVFYYGVFQDRKSYRIIFRYSISIIKWHKYLCSNGLIIAKPKPSVIELV